MAKKKKDKYVENPVKKAKKKKEKKSDREVVEALLQLSEVMVNQMRLEIANVLCQLGHCEDLLSDCPICKLEELQEKSSEA
tara:strand:- start:59 stop:301 length:243 start_codon:yes stop_codon:yes gene_type:complete